MPQRTRPRVANELGCVEPCACGGSNLHLGIVTLHVDRHRVPEFLELAQGLEAQATPPDSPEPPAQDSPPAPVRRKRRSGQARVLH